MRMWTYDEKNEEKVEFSTSIGIIGEAIKQQQHILTLNPKQSFLHNEQVDISTNSLLLTVPVVEVN